MSLKINDAIVHLIWLRDNCRCDECYNWETHQRKNSNLPDIYSMKSYTRSENIIDIIWSDGHKSQYDINWVLDQQPPGNAEIVSSQLWTAREIRDLLPSISSVNNTLTEDDTRTLIKALLQLGLAFVQNVDPTKESTEKIVSHVGPVMNTIYGGMWDIDSGLFDKFRDTAYTQEYLSCHTDNTYFIEPAGLQVFHCTKPADEGGETLFVDGFKAAKLLKERYGRFYECLKSTPIEWQYISNDYHLRHVSKILKTREFDDELEQVRFNIYDRSPRLPFTKNTDLFYRSVNSFQKHIQNSTLQLKVQLQPGTVAFVNNWRVLHGRTSFRGQRKIHGCYVAMGALLSKAGKLGLLK